MAKRQLRLNKYGWRPDKPDLRDMKYSAPRKLVAAELPRKVDLRNYCPSPYDQGDLGSCTGQALAGMMQTNYIKRDPSKSFQPSALFIYYNERVLENTIHEDAGAELRNGIKSLVRWGVCPEQYHPYIISKYKTKPSPLAYKNAIPHRIEKYMRISHNLNDLKACLADEHPFVFGFMVYESFESDEVASTGIVPMPNIDKESALGGHAVMACGYDDDIQRFIIRNSWGSNWGDKGYFTLSYDYVTNNDLSDDFWTIHYLS